MTDTELLFELYKRLDYDRESGELGTRSTGGKLQTKFKGQRYNVDALIWFMENGTLPKNNIVHLDNDNGNSRIDNLADMTRSELQQYKQSIVSMEATRDELARINISFDSGVVVPAFDILDG